MFRSYVFYRVGIVGWTYISTRNFFILIFYQALVVIQDLLRVFLIRIACQNDKYASMLLRPVLSSIIHHVSESSLSETDAYKVRIMSAPKFVGFSHLTWHYPEFSSFIFRSQGILIFLSAYWSTHLARSMHFYFTAFLLCSRSSFS